MKKPLGFLEYYKGRISEEVDQKVRAWGDRLLEQKMQRVLRSGHDYRRREFSTRVSHGSSAFDLILAVDICRRCLLEVAIYTSLSLLESNREDKQDEKETQASLSVIRASLSLSTYMWQMTDAIYRLFLSEHDVSSRILARSLLEASDYWLAMQTDWDLANLYVESSEQFNSLWYSHLRSDKIVKLRKEALANSFGEVLAKEVGEFRDEGARDFSEAVHPSYTAGLWPLVSSPRLQPPTAEWAFLKDWPHRRVAVFAVDCATLPLSLFLLKVSGSSPEWSFFPEIKSNRIIYSRERLTTLLHGSILASSLVATHHLRHPEP